MGFMGNYVNDPGVVGAAGIASGELAANSVVSGTVASGAIVGTAGGAMMIASGTIGTNDIASGAAITYSRIVCAVRSGYAPNYLAGEVISGGMAVCFDSIGLVQVAMASVSGRQPAFGIAIANAGVGEELTVCTAGFHQLTSGLVNLAGPQGRRVWLGRSGQVVTVSGGWASGGWLSGDVGQILGFVSNSGGVIINVSPEVYSGGPFGRGLMPFGIL